ncbi:MAG: ABC-type transport auxiliary lipoprotein family protein [Litoreibacter sp.]
MKSYCVIALMFVAACGGNSERYTVPQPVVGETQRISYSSVEVRDISLPSYAASDEIHVESESGALQSSASVLWADTPERAVSLALARNLAEITNAKVANEPWPFQSFPQARVEVRIEEMIATNEGVFRLKGQYFVASTRGTRERSGLFELTTPYDQEAGPNAVAVARGQVILALAREIAVSGLR